MARQEQKLLDEQARLLKERQELWTALQDARAKAATPSAVDATHRAGEAVTATAQEAGDLPADVKAHAATAATPPTPDDGNGTGATADVPVPLPSIPLLQQLQAQAQQAAETGGPGAPRSMLF